jgi:ketosteroid isomerase-like protein
VTAAVIGDSATAVDLRGVDAEAMTTERGRVAASGTGAIGEDDPMHQETGGRGSGELVDELLAALNAHDASAVGDLMTPDAEYVCWSGDSWATTRGRDAIVQQIDGYDKELSSDFRLTKTFAVVTHEGFAVEYHETGTNDRGAHASGRVFSLRNVMVGEVRAGRVSRLTDYSDVIAFRAQTT